MIDAPAAAGSPRKAAGFERAAARAACRTGILQSRTLLPAALPCSQLGIAERVVVGLMSRLASHAVVEPVPVSGGDASQPPAYRLLQPYSGAAGQQQQQRRSGRRGGGPGGGGGLQPKVGRPGPNSSQVGTCSGPEISSFGVVAFAVPSCR